MIDSYLTAGLTRGLSLALSPQAVTHDPTGERFENRQVQLEAIKPRQKVKTFAMRRLASLFSLVVNRPDQRSREEPETVNCSG